MELNFWNEKAIVMSGMKTAPSFSDIFNFLECKDHSSDATTLSITTFGITTLSIAIQRRCSARMTVNITTLGINDR
jgi:hypothetical protein